MHGTKPKEQEIENPKAMLESFISKSVGFGFKVGFLLSTIYAIIGTFVVLLIEGDIRYFLMVLGMGFPVIFLTSIFPAMLIGGWTGMIVGRIAESHFVRQFSKTVFVIMSMIICGLTAFLIHILFGIQIVLSFESSNSYMSFGFLETYPFLFGIPTIIYILAGGWFGWKAYSKVIKL